MYCLCLHNEVLPIIKKLNYIPVGLGSNNFSSEWIKDNTLENISKKNKYYSEYTFHYWFWKNVLPKIENNKWIGFCAYREYWGNKNKITNDSKIEDIVIKKIPDEWNKYDTIIGEHLYINNLKLSKLIKHGLWSLIRNPLAILKSKRSIRFHFDMWHGNGNLDKAINLLEVEENWNNPLVRDPWHFTEGRMRYTAPQRDFKWENLPTNSDAYLFPVMSKKYLKEIGYYN